MEKHENDTTIMTESGQGMPTQAPSSQPSTRLSVQLSLARHFPSIRSRKETLQIITASPALSALFAQWDQSVREEFLAQCCGEKGIKVLYDGIFKEIFNPENTPERLSALLSLLLGRKVAVLQALPNDSVRLGAESSLLYTDIIVQLEDGSLCDVEVQKLGYAFPSQRCACYSADHLLRQCKRVRGEKGKHFNYRDIKQVYTIVLFEKSPVELHPYKDCWLHRFRQRSDSGLTMDFLQEFILIPLDIYRKSMENRPISTVLEAWLAFLSFTDPVRIEELIVRYPMFKDMYQQAYDLCFDTERVMNMFSKELAILDHNTVMYMIDEMQERIERQEEELGRKEEELQESRRQQKEERRKNEEEFRRLRARIAELERHTGE